MGAKTPPVAGNRRFHRRSGAISPPVASSGLSRMDRATKLSTDLRSGVIDVLPGAKRLAAWFPPVKPITRSQALRQGYTDKELRGPRFQRLFQGVYLPSGVRVTLLHRAHGGSAGRATRRVRQPSHRGRPLGRDRPRHRGHAHQRARRSHPLDPARHLRPSGGPGNRPGRPSRRDDVAPAGHLSPARQPQARPGGVGGAGGLSRASQAGSRRRGWSKLLRSWNGKGARLARRAAGLVRRGVDSAMETRVRLLIVLAGLPEPQVNFIVRGEDGGLAAAVRPLLSRAEADRRIRRAAGTSGTRLEWHRDIQRREWMDAHGWRIIVVTSDDVFTDPAATRTPGS